MGDPAQPRTERWRSNEAEFDLPMVVELELAEGTWFEVAAEPPVDLPLLVLIPVPRLTTEA